MIDWKDLKVLDKAKREPNCFISPEGDWYNVEFGLHWEFTKSVLTDLYGIDNYGSAYIIDGNSRVREDSKELHDRGWVWVHDDIMSGTIITGRMNGRQHKILKEFFGDTRLFRGWTVDQLYYQQET